MKKVLFVFLFAPLLCAQISFNEYFIPKTLRIDYAHAGNKTNDFYYFEELKQEPVWGGTQTELIDPFNYGKYMVEVKDIATGKIIYTHYYSTLFSEWQTTEEAQKTDKSFPESVVMPYPKKPVTVTFYTRGKKDVLSPKFKMDVDPQSYFISKELKHQYPSFPIVSSGDPAQKVDIVIIPEGYTKSEMGKFKEDCDRFAGYLFNSSPYKENKNKFNLWGIEAPSLQSGTDVPGDGSFVNTVANSSFYTFDVERYCMIEDYQTVRDLAANAPYDQIYILVNTAKYGGGAIYNFYSVCVADDPNAEYIFTHEFGHVFAFLADEYYTSETGYIDFYDLTIEPLEPNITTLVEFDKKWKSMLSPGTKVPTPPNEANKQTLGVFEGGGYIAKGIYRPKMDCSMKSISVDNYCPVCQRAIKQMIEHYAK